MLTNSLQVLPQNHQLLKLETKDQFLGAIGHNAIKVLTKTVTEKETTSIPLYNLYALIRLNFTPGRNVQFNRADPRFWILNRDQTADFSNSQQNRQSPA